MDKPKLYMLERENNFWEIVIKKKSEDKNDTTTTIRAGKKGNKGRQFPAKKHENYKKAKQFALQQVNSKIIQGFSPVQPASTSCKAQLKRTASSMRRVTPKATSIAKATSITKDWRRPPKKQTTIRRLGRQVTLKGSDLLATPLSRKNSIIQKNMFTNIKNTNVISKTKLSRQATLQIADVESSPAESTFTRSTSRSKGNMPVDKSVAKWRKPHKKQSTIRRMAKSQTLKQSPSLRKTLF